MKYLFRVLIVLLIAVGVVFGVSYFYRQDKNADKIQLTTAHITKKQETTGIERILLAESKEANTQVYLYGEDVIIARNGLEATVEDVRWCAMAENPEIYMYDYNNDGKKEVIVKMVGGNAKSESPDKYVYTIRLINIVKGEDGKDQIEIVNAFKDTWKKTFEKSIRSEMSQLKSNPKFIQLVMDDAKEQITYNNKTGISDNKYVFYARAEKNASGYLTFSRWSKGDGIYKVDKDGKITVDIQVLAYYEEMKKPQYIGYIHAGIYIKDGRFAVKPGTIKFDTRDEYAINDPRVTADKDWSYVINNNYTNGTVDDNKISWIETDLELDSSVTEKTISFADFDSQIKCASSIEFNQDSIIITSREGFSYLDSYLEKGQYAVKVENKKGIVIDICDEATIEQSGTQQRLILKLDKRYTKDELKSCTIQYGI